MAVQAPLHLQRILLIHERHFIHAAVTTGAADTFIHVDTVIEVHKVRQIVDARPLDRFAAAEAEPYGLEHGGVRPDQRMTIHAGFRRRNPGKAGVFNGSMAITAIQSQAGSVVLMAERNGLLGRYVLSGDIRRALKLQ